MPRKALSDPFLRTVKVDRDTEWYDIGHPLILRASSAGTKSWSTRVRIRGQHVRMPLGRYPHVGLSEARDKAAEIHRMAERGMDPRGPQRGGETAAQARLLVRQYLESDAGPERDRLRAELAGLPVERRAPSVAEIAARYLELHGRPNTVSWHVVEQTLFRHVFPVIGASEAERLRRRDIHALLDRVGSGRTIANRVLANLRTIYRWALERELVEIDPTAGIRRPTREQPAGSILSDGEIRAAWEALEDVGTIGTWCLRVIALTCCRQREVREGRWEELDGRQWVIPAERMKGKQGARRPHLVTLSDWCAEILDKLRPVHPEVMFPSLQGPAARVFRADGTPYVQPHRPPLRSLAMIMPVVQKRSGVPHFNARILRRTGATLLGRLGFREEVIGAVLAHAPLTVTGRHYQLYRFQEEKAAALQALADEYRRILGRSERAGKVLPIR